ncbi:hypothetical protein GCM10027068_13760 [Prescottella soli]
MAMQVGLNLLGTEAIYGGDIRSVLDLAATADRTGIDMITTGDHVGFNATAHAQRLVSDQFPFPLEHPWFEPLALMSAVAAVTQNARLGMSVLVATLRPATLLAKQLATLDIVSGGRISIGMGVGWQEAEYTATGMPFDGRFGRLEQTVEACRELWTAAPATFAGRGFEFEDFYCLPHPKQHRVPIQFGMAPSQRNFDRIARVADGWSVNPNDMRGFAESVALLRATFAAHGRDPESAEVHIQLNPSRDSSGTVDLDATAEAAHRWHSAGATTIAFLPSRFDADANSIPELIDWMVGLKTLN